MARRLMTLISLLALIVPQISFGAEAPSPHKATKSAPADTEAEKAPSINILSIVPAQGEPGGTVTLYGTGFTRKTAVFLGSMELPAKVSGSKELSFDIPKLDPGLYALFLKREDGSASKPYNFSILPLRPVAVSLSPDTVFACATGHEREVAVSGRNFQEGAQVLFDGAAIKTGFSSPESLTFAAPQVAGGLHQVQVKNPADTVSGVLGLAIDAQPEITGVNRGDEYVNYYNLIIDGRNFQQNSALVIMEERTLEETPSRLAVDVKRITSSSGSSTEREQILFINCNRIVYQRHPYSTIPKNFSIQVVNPGGGGESAVVSVSAP
ncbi:MAG TPA: IPT/TIG domain-containing protein [Geobacteraceae bacterium]